MTRPGSTRRAASPAIVVAWPAVALRFLALLFVALLAVARAPAAVAQGAAVWPQEEFCGRAQSYITGGTPRATNTIHDGIESFRRTPPSAQPLTTQQYDWPDDRGAPSSATMISCKLVTADRIKAAYGPQAARSQATCEQVNRHTLSTVLASLTPQERDRALFGKGRKVRLERDRRLDGTEDWYAPYEMASVDRSGRLRIVANALRADGAGANPSALPDDSRGVQFCHLIAPDYLRRLLLDPSIVLPGPPAVTRR